MKRTTGIAGLVACALLAFACDSSTDTRISYAAVMTGAKEVPPITSNGTGAFTASLDENNLLTYSFNFTGLTGTATLSHIHGPATTLQSVGVLVDFNNAAAGRLITLGSTAGTASGTIDLTTQISTTVSGDSLRKLFDLGLLYVNVHSSSFGAGEIRGQITRQ